MVTKLLEERGIPELLSRPEMLDILQEEAYGYLPLRPDKISWKVEQGIIPNFCAGKSTIDKVTAVCEMNEKVFSFPFYVCIPTIGAKHPFFVHINFRNCVPDRYMPTEELIDNGFAVLSFCYEDITKDNDDFTDGICGVLFENGRRKVNDAGKISMWAWAAQRVMDYAQIREDVLDLKYSIVCGHSRLGKTALLAAATDVRFKFVYSNDSGCMGASLTRKRQGESVKDICEKFHYWFCDNLQKYIDNEHNMPFDQHYLLACISPRKVLVGSAAEDTWSDPVSEFMCCVAAGPAFGGFVNEDMPQEGDKFFDGPIGYHLRKGKHYFSREDWLRLIEYVNNKHYL